MLNAITREPGGNICAAGEAGFQSWDGQAWLVHPAPAVPPPPGATGTRPAIITGLAARGARDLWAVGVVYFVVVPQLPSMPSGAVSFHWDGSSWAYRGGFLPSAFSHASFNAVAAVEDEVWAVGSTDGAPLAMRWNGKWARVSLPGKRTVLTGIDGEHSDNIWVVGWRWGPPGSYPNRGVALRWSGYGWEIHEPPDVGEAYGLYGVAVVGADDVWAVGARGSQPGRPIALHWDGSRWWDVPLPKTVRTGVLWAVGSSGPKRVWAVGGGDAVAPDWALQPVIVRWNGTAFTRESAPGLSVLGSEYGNRFDYLRAIWVAPHEVWAAGLGSHDTPVWGTADAVRKR